MKLRYLAVGVLAAFSVASAQALTANLGTLPQGTTFLGGSANVDVYVPPKPLSLFNFSDSFSFSISPSSLLSGGTAWVTSFVNAPNLLNFSSFQFALYSGATNLTGDLGAGQSFATSLGAGDYELKVFGKTSGLAGGAYNGSLQVAAVPEPETYAMLLAGLGVMGFVARRRRNNG